VVNFKGRPPYDTYEETLFFISLRLRWPVKLDLIGLKRLFLFP
jgi:hypothetical protein